ncbi:MAG: UDP-N-acetylmuramoyl-tripeptide--D-alanyl-D-alanine ligase [Xanthomonadales bacterium]
MIQLSLSDLAGVLDCEIPAGGVLVDSIVTDSRQVHYGALFAALPGSQVDGHDFASTAVGLGAVALLVSRRLDLDVPQLVVKDVLPALGRLARLVRDRVNPRVIGITGSNGKTTVKEMLSSILRRHGKVLATRGNYNNELGVPLSLFELAPDHRYAVLELGASKSGDIAYLTGIAGLDVGLVTNVGPAHLQGFGDEQGVAEAKGEIFAGLPASGWAIINGDEQWSSAWRKTSTAGHTLTFGTQAGNDVRLEHRDGQARIAAPQGSFDLEIPLPGEHNLLNATAAAAAAIALDIPLDAIRSGLAAVKPVPGRLNLLRTASGCTVIDDTYNANPASLYSALQVLAKMQGKAWLVLGDMKELGSRSRKLHAEVGDAARSLGVSRLFATGEMSKFTVEAFGQGATHFEDREALIEALIPELKPRINCLVKGSRSMGMEAVVAAIRQERGMREAS